MRAFLLLLAAVLGAIGIGLGVMSAAGETSTMPPAAFFAAWSTNRSTSMSIEAFSATGVPLRAVVGGLPNASTVAGPFAGPNGSLWYTETRGPRCAGDGADMECSMNPASCHDALVEVAPSGARSVLLQPSDTTNLTAAVPSRNGHLVALRMGRCARDFLDQHFEIWDRSTGRAWTVGASLAACHELSPPAWNKTGGLLTFAYAPSRLPKSSHFVPTSSCLSPAPGRLVVAPARRASAPATWRTATATSGCGYKDAAFDRAGIVAVETCGQDGLGRAYLVQLNLRLRVSRRLLLAPGANDATVMANDSGSAVLVDEYETYHSPADAAGVHRGPGGLRPGPFVWIDVYNGKTLRVVHRFVNTVAAPSGATW